MAFRNKHGQEVGVMPAFLLKFYAPKGVVSPDAEECDLIVGAKDEAEARLAAEAVVRMERRCLETFLWWHSSYDEGPPFAHDIRCVGAYPTGCRPEITAAEIFEEEKA